MYVLDLSIPHHDIVRTVFKVKMWSKLIKCISCAAKLLVHAFLRRENRLLKLDFFPFLNPLLGFHLSIYLFAYFPILWIGVQHTISCGYGIRVKLNIFFCFNLLLTEENVITYTEGKITLFSFLFFPFLNNTKYPGNTFIACTSENLVVHSH